MKPISVCHVITGLSRGGAETMLHKLVCTLPSDSGFLHSIVTLTDGIQFDFEGLGVPVRTLGLARRLPALPSLPRLRREVASTRPDVIQGWMYHGNVAATLAAIGGARAPVVWGIRHSLHDLPGEKRLTRLLIRFGAALGRHPRVRAIIYCSDASREQHERIGYPTSKSVYIPNGFDCDRFSPNAAARDRVRAALGLSRETVLIGSAARFDPIKNHEGLVNAFSSVASRHPEAVLLLAGRGLSEDNQDLMVSIRRGRHASRILLLGERDDVPDLFAALDVFVLSSRSEGFPNVLGEAMACGVPCVTTDVGDAGLIVGDTGLVVPAGNMEALASALSDAIGLPASERRLLGIRARSKILDSYSMRAVAERYASVYRNVTDSLG